MFIVCMIRLQTERSDFYNVAFGLLTGLLLTFPFWGALWGNLYVVWFNTRIPAHECTYGGYDLTGNVSVICSECGRLLKETPQ